MSTSTDLGKIWKLAATSATIPGGDHFPTMRGGILLEGAKGGLYGSTHSGHRR